MKRQTLQKIMAILAEEGEHSLVLACAAQGLDAKERLLSEMAPPLLDDVNETEGTVSAVRSFNKVLSVSNLFFILPDNFSGDIGDALVALGNYIKSHARMEGTKAKVVKYDPKLGEETYTQAWEKFQEIVTTSGTKRVRGWADVFVWSADLQDWVLPNGTTKSRILTVANKKGE